MDQISHNDQHKPASRVITGLRPTGSLHIGNLITSVARLVELQKTQECLLFVADLHAITTPYEPKELRARVIDTVRLYLAAGVDPDKCLIFVQSEVSQHTELGWILSSLLPVAELERMTQYKEKTAQHKKPNLGLFSYPALMAADILLYDADLVPVGQDQVQHVELTRTAARKFNKAFGETFRVPRPYVAHDRARIIGLDGKGKMSKSLGNTLNLLDSPEVIGKKIRKAVINPERPTSFEGAKPITIFELHDQLFPDVQTAELSKQCHRENRNCKDYKELVAQNLAAYLAPIRQRYAELAAKGDAYIERFLAANADLARARAEQTMQRVREASGLR
ncbi:MAG: tryptophan--tRNA ligase [bacterium]|nr:tryptophan--tRNA ligase [bacterium]